MKDKLYNSMQKFSHAIIQPVMFMAVAGILIAISAVLKIDFMPDIIKSFGDFLNKVLVGGMISNLSVVFCIGIAVALVPDKKTAAAVISIISFLIFLQANNFWLAHTESLAQEGEFGLSGSGQGMVLGVQVTDMGVFLGILIGCISGFVLNKCKDVKFPKYLSIYEGANFAFFIMIIVTSILAIGVTYIWPIFNIVLNRLMIWIANSGPVGFFVYGFVNRLALPLGLHHLLWVPMGYSPIGGQAVINGQTFYGANNIRYAELANLDKISSIDPSIGSIVNFGYTALPIGIALALIKTSRKENKEKVKAMVYPAVAASLLAGITEPIEFLFLFGSPILWIAHAIIYGFGMLLSSILGLRVMVETVITTLLYSLAVPIEMGRQWLIPIIFVILTFIEYSVFKFIIEKLDLNTIGRKMPTEEEMEEAKRKRDARKGKKVSKDNISEDKSDDKSDAYIIVDGLGGKENIKSLENCYTRLRICVEDPSKVNKDILEKYPSKGIVESGDNIQIIIGLGVEEVKQSVENEMNK